MSLPTTESRKLPDSLFIVFSCGSLTNSPTLPCRREIIYTKKLKYTGGQNMAKDFIPKIGRLLPIGRTIINSQLQNLAAKYGISAGKLTQTQKDNDWVKYWGQAKFNAKAQDKQLTDYADTIANGNLGTPQPNEPTWALPPDSPLAVAPGIKRRFREIAAEIKAQKSIYTQADGELLGIVAPDEGSLSPETTAPDLKLNSMPNFALGVEFRKYGRCPARRISSQRRKLAVSHDFNEQPGRVQHRPDQTPADAEQIEIRRIFIDKNQHFGIFSPIYTAVIQP